MFRGLDIGTKGYRKTADDISDEIHETPSGRQFMGQ